MLFFQLNLETPRKIRVSIDPDDETEPVVQIPLTHDENKAYVRMESLKKKFTSAEGLDIKTVDNTWVL